MTRTTKGNVEAAFGFLCKAMGKRIATDWNDVGAWRLDHNSCYGGYIIEEILSEKGAIRHPLSNERRKASEFYDACWFAIRAVELTAEETDG